MQKYITTDLDLAATMIAFKFNCELQKGRFVEFVFEVDDEFDQVLTKYSRETLLVQPQYLLEARRRLAARLNNFNQNYNAKRNQDYEMLQH